jgi:hypothetical protein
MSAASGQITVTTAGTAVQGPATEPGDYLIRGMPANTGAYVYFGNDGAGDVSSSNGYVLGSGEQAVVHVGSLNELFFDVTTNGDKLAWFKMDKQKLP